MTTQSKQLAKFLIRILIATVLLIWVFSQINLQQFLQTVKTARWQYLLAVWALTVIFFLIRSISLQLILKKQSCDVSIITLFGASAVTSLYSMVIPGILSTGVKWYILRKDTGKGSNVLSSMVYNQISLFVVIAIFGLIALIVTNPMSLLLPNAKNNWLLPLICSMLLSATVLISVLLLSSTTGPKIIDALGSLLKPIPQAFRQKTLKILNQIAIFQTASATFNLTILFITVIAVIVVGVFMYTLATKAANVTIPVGVLVWLCAIIFLLGRVPISIANLGVREVTLVSILTVYGVDKSSALLMSMILFSSQVFMAIIGAIYQFIWMLKAKK